MTQVDKPNRLGYSRNMKTRKVFVEVKVPWNKAQKDEVPENMSLRDFLVRLLLGEKTDFASTDVHGQAVVEEVASVIETGKFFYYEKGDPEWQERIRLIGARNLGKLGGAAKSRAKSAASRANGKKGGRPKKGSARTQQVTHDE